MLNAVLRFGKGDRKQLLTNMQTNCGAVRGPDGLQLQNMLRNQAHSSLLTFVCYKALRDLVSNVRYCQVSYYMSFSLRMIQYDLQGGQPWFVLQLLQKYITVVTPEYRSKCILHKTSKHSSLIAFANAEYWYRATPPIVEKYNRYSESVPEG